MPVIYSHRYDASSSSSSTAANAIRVGTLNLADGTLFELRNEGLPISLPSGTTLVVTLFKFTTLISPTVSDPGDLTTYLTVSLGTDAQVYWSIKKQAYRQGSTILVDILRK